MTRYDILDDTFGQILANIYHFVLLDGQENYIQQCLNPLQLDLI